VHHPRPDQLQGAPVFELPVQAGAPIFSSPIFPCRGTPHAKITHQRVTLSTVARPSDGHRPGAAAGHQNAPTAFPESPPARLADTGRRNRNRLDRLKASLSMAPLAVAAQFSGSSGNGNSQADADTRGCISRGNPGIPICANAPATQRVTTNPSRYNQNPPALAAESPSARDADRRRANPILRKGARKRKTPLKPAGQVNGGEGISLQPIRAD
jgi:hypothetical protein